MFTYDAWGNFQQIYDISPELSKAILFRYRSYIYDSDIGLYYLQTRYYDPQVGRFINIDNIDVLTATPMALTDKNLYAYCDNNPVMRADHGGEFWHILVGAAAGAIISGVIQVASNIIEGNSITDGLGIATVSGALSGALASTGVGLAGMVIGNAAISMATNAVEQVIENDCFDNFDVGDMLIDGAIGAISGAIGGPGKGSKHLTNLGKQTVKRTVNATKHQGLKSGIKEAGKAFAYYSKNTVTYYTSLKNSLVKDFFNTVGTTTFKNYILRR